MGALRAHVPVLGIGGIFACSESVRAIAPSSCSLLANICLVFNAGVMDVVFSYGPLFPTSQYMLAVSR